MLKFLTSLYLFALFCHALYFYRRLLKQLHMLQLNSYYNNRYSTWVRRNFTSLFHLREWLPLLALGGMIFDKSITSLLLFTSCSLELFFRNYPQEVKKPLVFTPRIWRLLGLHTLILCSIYFCLSYLSWYHGAYWINSTILYLGLLTLLLPFVTTFMNFLLLPLENSIQYWYLQDAKRYLRNLPKLESIAITGSYGKTTTKYILAELLKNRFYTLKTPGSYNTLMGITKIIRTKLRQAHECFVVEMSAKQPGDIKQICTLVKPRYGLITVIGEQHLETFKTLEAIQATKAELLSSLPTHGIAFLNADDPNSLTLQTQIPCKKVLFGIENTADYQITQWQTSTSGMTFTVHTPTGTQQFTTTLLGKQNLYDLIGAIAVAAEKGIPLDLMYNTVKQLKSVPHRLELKKVSTETYFIDDAFNANPVGAQNALEVLKQFTDYRKIIVTPGLIELGDKQEQYNQHLGQLIAQTCNYVILVGPKQTRAIQVGMQEQNFNFEHCFIASSLTVARQHLESILQSKDVVLFENDLPDDYQEF